MIAFLFGLGFAFWAFLIACAILPKLWQSGVVALAIFCACILAITCDIKVLLWIILLSLPLSTIIIVFGKNKDDHSAILFSMPQICPVWAFLFYPTNHHPYTHKTSHTKNLPTLR